MRADAFGNRPQKQIASLVAACVVDDFESVQIDQQKRRYFPVFLAFVDSRADIFG